MDPTICRKLRRCSLEKYLPIILMIPEETEGLERYLCGSDADDYFCLPYTPTELEARLMFRLSAAQRIIPRTIPQIDISFLSSLSGLVFSDQTSSEILQQVVNSVSQVINVQRCSVALTPREKGVICVMASSDDPSVNGLWIDLGRYPEIQDTIATGRSLLIDDIYCHPMMEPVRDHLKGVPFNSIMVLPMIDRHRIIGVFILRSSRPISRFSEEEIAFCQLVANVATCVLRLAEVRAADEEFRHRGIDPDNVVVKSTNEQSSLLDMAAHDLRVLVSVIDGYCTLFSEAADGSLLPEQSQIIDGLMAGNRRLVDMANDLLDFSQLNSGSFELRMMEQDLSQIIASVCNELSALLQRRNITLQTGCLDKDVPVVCDEQSIRRVFYNIVNNAMKFTPEGGSIKLDLDQIDGEVRVSIEDSGPGIEPGKISQLFNEYTMVSPNDPRAGNGLGLSICKKIVEAHHGRIWAESCLGQGSRFTFCLPQ
ncbi:ATP-binding protein [Malonomonas rubra]|uniref:ATP-binding protein n=1 Tax=Malonomonas rubra TaxID=57040 RepID=UPI0026ED0C4B|nr:ATP-binding protein [Malonomonas rubra]